MYSVQKGIPQCERRHKGPYPLGDFRKIGTVLGAIIGAIIGGQRPIIAPATPWVWPKIAGRLLGDHSHSRMFDISLPTDRPATTVARQSVGMFVNLLVGMGL